MVFEFKLSDTNRNGSIIILLVKYTCIFLFFILVKNKSFAQFSSADSLEVERLYYSMVDANDENEVDVAIAKADSLMHFCEKKKAWYFAYGLGLHWKITIASINDRVGLYYESIKEMDAKLILHQKELGAQSNILKLDNKLSLGSYYSKIGNLDLAQSVFEELLMKDIEDKAAYYETPTLLMHLSKVHKLQGNYFQALKYILECYELFNQQKETEFFTLGYEALINKHLGDIYALLDKVALAKQHYNKSIDLNKHLEQEDRMMHNGVINNYNAFAKFLQKQKNYTEAIQILEKSLSLQSKQVSNTENTYRLLAELQVQLDNYPKAKFYYDKSLSANQYTQKNYQTARTYTSIGNMHFKQKNYQDALDYYQKALQNLHESFVDKNYCTNPSDWNKGWVKRDLLKTLHKKSLALFELANSDSKYLKCAWETIQLAISLFENIRIGNTSETDKQNFVEEIYPIFEDAIKISLAQPNHIGDTFAFKVAEKSKSALLLAAVRNTQIKDYLVPDSLINLEYQYQFEINKLKASQYENEQKQLDTLPVVNRILDLESKLFHLKQSYQKDFPNYFELRYNTEVSSTEKIKQRLLDKQILIEYFVGSEQTYIFVLNKLEPVKVISVDISDQELGNLVEDLLQAIYTPFIADDTDSSSSKALSYLQQKSDSLYATCAYQLYEVLLAPVLSNNLVSPSKIEIISDGVLNYLPFDALIQSEVSPKALGFYENESDYKFIARDYPISYGYSSTLQNLMNKQEIVNKEAFGLLMFTDNDFIAQSYTIQEIFKPFSFFKPFVKSLLAQSNKINLRQFSNNFEYLHFSVHGVIDNERPAQSHLKLRSDINGDSLLYLRDIYSLRLPAKMVITSACDAGVGKLSKGEGLLSLARGFTYAGAQSLITTLWPINGGAADQLLGNFYKKLTKGYSKDAALFEAKRTNLKTAAYAHPYYWASFIPIGNMQSIDTPMSQRQLLLSLGLVLILVILLWRRFLS